MEWRCEWCGKPHEADDPPCDECGHGTFERAIVQRPAEGPAGNSTVVWVCTDCGREHPKHAPPCSRCGNRTLERREITVDDAEVSVPGYRDLLTPRYALGFAVAIVLGVVLLLGVAGVVDLPGTTDPSVPTVEDVPGSGDSYEGTSLVAVEAAYLDRLDAARTDRGGRPFDRDDHLTAVARYVNHRSVKQDQQFGGGVDDERLSELLSPACDGRVTPVGFRSEATGGQDGEVLGRTLADTAIEEFDAADPARGDATGVDVHVLDGTLYLVQFTC